MRQRPSNRYGSRLSAPVWRVAAVLLAAVAVLAGCSEDVSEPTPVEPNRPGPAPQIEAPRVDPISEPEDVPSTYVGDLDVLRERGRLRILIPANIGGVFYLPRAGWPVVLQHEAAEAFARSKGLEPELVPVDRFAEMIPALLDGRGDVVAANLTVTESRRKKLAFSVPLTTVRQQVLVARGNDAIRREQDLAGKHVMVDRGSSFWERLEGLQQRYPDVELVARPDGYSDEQELDAVVPVVMWMRRFVTATWPRCTWPTGTISSSRSSCPVPMQLHGASGPMRRSCSMP
jgi:ABC-type amino acid transport substrate-binding protein